MRGRDALAARVRGNTQADLFATKFVCHVIDFIYLLPVSESVARNDASERASDIEARLLRRSTTSVVVGRHEFYRDGKCVTLILPFIVDNYNTDNRDPRLA